MSHITSYSIKRQTGAVALSIGWQNLKVQARGLFYSARERADATNLAIMCLDNQQKKKSKIKSMW